jgi:hypothetical protein
VAKVTIKIFFKFILSLETSIIVKWFGWISSILNLLQENCFLGKWLTCFWILEICVEKRTPRTFRGFSLTIWIIKFRNLILYYLLIVILSPKWGRIWRLKILILFHNLWLVLLLGTNFDLNFIHPPFGLFFKSLNFFKEPWHNLLNVIIFPLTQQLFFQSQATSVLNRIYFLLIITFSSW